MPSATLKGKATVDGINGAVTYSAIVANGALDPLTAEVTDQVDVQERVDGNGFIRGFRLRNARKEISVVCLASVSAGNALADAKKAVIFPPKPSVVTLSGFDEAAAAGINGDYLYRGGGSISYGDDWVRITLPIQKYEHATSVDLTATVA